MDKRLKYSIGTFEIIGIAVGVILLAILEEYVKVNRISDTLEIVSYVKCAVTTFISALCGPVAGGIVGFLSSFITGMIKSEPVQYNMVVAYSMFGYFIGTFANRYGIREGKFSVMSITNFNCIQICANIMVFALFVPLTRILVKKLPISLVIKSSLRSALYNICLNFVIMTTLFFIISCVTRKVSEKTKIN